MTHHTIYPFAAIVGQEELKLSLILNTVNPMIGGVLIRGEKGTAKSTTVRALASLLPLLTIRSGCPYSCDPEDKAALCHYCLQHQDKNISRRRTRVVTLPLNATEDRVAGGIDFNLAVNYGKRSLQPGLLAEAHRGILYVDEINLLDDHIVDIILSAASSGINVVEREGLSLTHPARFILVGTMNPEEGALRPQLLDRFGLCVDVSAESDKKRRVVLMERRESFDADPKKFLEQYAKENAKIAGSIHASRRRMGRIVMPDRLRRLCAQLCSENNVAGHRADLVMEQGAKALAAYLGHPEVLEEDIAQVAQMVFLHRKRETAPSPPPPTDHEKKHDHDHDDKSGENSQENRQDGDGPSKDRSGKETGKGESDGTNPQDRNNKGNLDFDKIENKHNRREEVLDQIFAVGETFKVQNFASSRDRIFRRGSGRRSRSCMLKKTGRYVKSALGEKTGDVALDATLRAAAPCQIHRKNNHGLAVVLKKEDIREKIREKRIGNFLLFLVDASGSMGARGRMVASKGAIMSLLLDAYQKRDRVAMVSFRKDQAVVNLPPSASIELAAALLRKMPVGGRTPLSAGLVKSYEMIRNYLCREPTGRPIVVIVTDGKTNVALGNQKPVDEARELASRLATDERIRFIVVDTESRGLVHFGLALELARSMNAKYFKTRDLRADTLVKIVKGEL